MSRSRHDMSSNIEKTVGLALESPKEEPVPVPITPYELHRARGI